MFPKSLHSNASLAFDFRFDMLALEEVGGFTIIGTSCLPNHLILDITHSLQGISEGKIQQVSVSGGEIEETLPSGQRSGSL